MAKGKANPGADAPQNTKLTFGASTQSFGGTKTPITHDISLENSKIKL